MKIFTTIYKLQKPPLPLLLFIGSYINTHIRFVQKAIRRKKILMTQLLALI